MPSSEISAVTMTLPQITDELHSTTKQIEKKQWRIAELLWAAREHFDVDDDKGFRKWAAVESGYTLSVTTSYIATYNRFKDNKLVSGNQKSDKPIPISSLRPLAAQNIDHRTVEKVVRKLVSDNPPNRDEVHKLAREAKPEFRPPAIVYSKTFAERVAPVIGKDFSWKPEQLLDIHDHASAETVRIVARYWKGQYHPDKGGDPDIFNRIVKAEKILLEMRGEK
jgi:hypothetical protein